MPIWSPYSLRSSRSYKALTIPWFYGFIGREYKIGDSPRFAVALAAFFVLEDHVYTTRRVAEVLSLEASIRKNVTVAPL